MESLAPLENRTMNRKNEIGLRIAAAASLLMIAGCTKPKPPPPPAPAPVWKAPESRASQTQELAQRVGELDSSLANLPGESMDDHRQRVAEILKNLSKILRLAEG